MEKEREKKEVEVIKLTLRNKFTKELCVVDCYSFDHLKRCIKDVIEASGNGLYRVVLTNIHVKHAVEELRRDFESNLVTG